MKNSAASFLCALLFSLSGCLVPVSTDVNDASVRDAGLVDAGSFADAGSFIDAGAPHPVAEFCLSYAIAFCDHSIACGNSSSGSKGECLSYVQGGCAGMVASEAAGYLSLDVAKAASCLAGFAIASCGSHPEFSCERQYRPLMNTGERCLASSDCTNAADVCSGHGCEKTCQPAGQLGQPCTRARACASELECNPGEWVCRSPKPVTLPGVGEACDGAHYPYCTPSAFCDGAVCHPRLGVGAACNGPDSCEATLRCDAVCKIPRAKGEACSATALCARTLACSNGTCATPASLGERCDAQTACAEGIPCDRVSRTCGATYFSQAVGESCSDHWNCQTRLTCRGAVENADGGVGTLGSCAVPAIGDPCYPSALINCPLSAFCRIGPTEDVGTCAPRTERARCSSTFTCATGDTCNFASDGGFECASTKKQGDRCEADSECPQPLHCVPQQTGARCAKLGDVGDSCSAQRSFLDTCLFPLTCSNGTCRHLGGPNEACFKGSVCLSGGCDLNTSVCRAKLPDGAGCGSTDSACASGYCSNGSCTAVCRSSL